MHPLMVGEIAREQQADMRRAADSQRRGRVGRRKMATRHGLRALFASPTQRVRVQTLEELPLFRGLPWRDLAFLARKADPVTFAEGKVLVREATPRPELFVITCGTAEASLRGKATGLLGAGDIFGERTVLDGGPQTATVTALSDGEGFVIGKREFVDVLETIPTVSKRLLVRMSEELRRFEHPSPVRTVVKLEQAEEDCVTC